jgi:hypothetical protein
VQCGFKRIDNTHQLIGESVQYYTRLKINGNEQNKKDIYGDVIKAL